MSALFAFILFVKTPVHVFVALTSGNEYAYCRSYYRTVQNEIELCLTVHGRAIQLAAGEQTVFVSNNDCCSHVFASSARALSFVRTTRPSVRPGI